MMENICNAKAYKELQNRNIKNKKINDYNIKLELLEDFLNTEYKKTLFFFDNYTDHGWIHTLKVLDYMYDLVYDPKTLTDEELMLIIFSALLHDIGMAYHSNEVDSVIDSSVLDEKISEYQKKHIGCSIDNARHDCIAEVIRVKHGQLSEKKIKQLVTRFKPVSYEAIFKLRSGNSLVDNWDLTDIVAMICRSHMESINWIQREFINCSSFMFIACLLRLADFLDIDNRRADLLYQTFFNIKRYSGLHFSFNQIVGDSDKIKICIDNPCILECPNKKADKPCSKRYKSIELLITFPLNLDHSDETQIRRMINDYRDDLETEIRAVNNLLDKLDDCYHIKLSANVYCNEVVNKPSSHERLTTHKLSVDYGAIMSFFSENQLYAERLCGIRELLQNAYDACKAYAELNLDEIDWEAKITILHDSKNNLLIIKDNGIGMSDYVLREYFLNLGKSKYNYEPKYIYDNYHKDHIGHFGLGFFASFMLSSKVVIITTDYLSKESIKVELDKDSNFATLIYGLPSLNHGTEVILDFNDVMDALEMYDENECMNLLGSYISEAFLWDGIRISLVKDRTLISDLKLPCVRKENWDLIDNYLIDVNASVDIYHKEFPLIFYASDSFNLKKVTYDQLLNRLAIHYKHNILLPYLDAGVFWIFPCDGVVYDDFKNMANEINPRMNYSIISNISQKIEINIKDFCIDNGIVMPTHCYFGLLNLLVEGKNSVLVERNIPCEGLRDIMKKNDACGEAQRTDKIFLRDINLPSLHVSLPYINFRYCFNGLIANIKTRDVFPTLPRDGLTIERTNEFSFALSYAICRHKVQNGQVKVEDKLMLEIYDEKSLKNNIFLREDNRICLQ